MKKEDEVIAKVRSNQPSLSTDDEARIRQSVREIEADPNICNACWSGGAYLDGRLICDCWPVAELRALEARARQGTIEGREVGDITYFTTKQT